MILIRFVSLFAYKNVDCKCEAHKTCVGFNNQHRKGVKINAQNSCEITFVVLQKRASNLMHNSHIMENYSSSFVLHHDDVC